MFLPTAPEVIRVPGSNMPFAFVLYNAGREDDSYISEITVPEGWTSSSIPTKNIASGHSIIVQFQVNVPKNAPSHTSYPIEVTTKSTQATEIEKTVVFSIRVDDTYNGYTDIDQDALNDEIEKEIGSDPFSPDTDRDGLFDGVEYTHDLTLFRPGDFQKAVEAKDPRTQSIFEHRDITFLDSDDDGLSDRYEKEHQLDPKNPDSDGDGFFDGLEAGTIGELTTIIDSDNDGLPDALEAGPLAFESSSESIHDNKTSLIEITDNEAFLEDDNPELISSGISSRDATESQSEELVTEEETAKDLASTIITTETIASRSIKTHNPLKTILNNKFAAITFGVCGSLFILAIIVVIYHKYRDQREEE